MVQSGSDSAAGVCEGDILAGKYRVERVLGIGGMGVVVAAHHIQLDEKVALKFLLPVALSNAEAVARFAREARAAVKIKSEHVARVTDVGTLPNGAPYLVMEYLDGVDLAAWLRERGPLPIEQAVEFVLQACIAVAEAHALGIVHRDLKPANLFCVRRSDGQLLIKVLDFGISKVAVAGASARETWVTETRAMMGSPLYMSPEQMESAKHVDAQTDIWALGVILFELMTGRPAFVGNSVMDLAIRVANQAAPAIRSLRFDVPSGLEAIVFKCLEKNRRQRYRDISELALDLLPYAPTRAKASVERIFGIIQGAGRSTSVLPVAVSSPQTGSTPPLGRTTAPAGRNNTVLGAALAGAAVVIVIAGLAFLLQRATTDRDNPRAAAPQPSSQSYSEPAPTSDQPQKPSDMRSMDPAPGAPVVPLTPPSTAEAEIATTPRKKLRVYAPAPVASHDDKVHPSASSPLLPTPLVSAAASESLEKEPIPLRSPRIRPKVQLERDNPWP